MPDDLTPMDPTDAPTEPPVDAPVEAPVDAPAPADVLPDTVPEGHATEHAAEPVVEAPALRNPDLPEDHFQNIIDPDSSVPPGDQVDAYRKAHPRTFRR